MNGEKTMSKYIGRIYDGRWEVVACEHYNGTSGSYRITLRNIYNNETTTVKDSTLRKIERGETTLSKVRSHKIKTKRIGRRTYE